MQAGPSSLEDSRYEFPGTEISSIFGLDPRSLRHQDEHADLYPIMGPSRDPSQGNNPNYPYYYTTSTSASQQPQYQTTNAYNYGYTTFATNPNVSAAAYQSSYAQQPYGNAGVAYQQSYQHPTQQSAYGTANSQSYQLISSTASAYNYNAAYASPTSQSMSMSAADAPTPNPASGGQAPTYLPTPRQIRFVATDGQPHTKRRRINAACLTCRKRKTRCSGEKPVCKTCSDNGHQCAGYASKSKRDKPDDDDDEDDEDDGDEPPYTAPPPARPTKHESSSHSHSHSHHDRSRSGHGESHSRDKHSRAPHSGGHRWMLNELPEEIRSPVSAVTAGTPGTTGTTGSGGGTTGHTRVPYFRYFGPTAVVPGFKQMVVQMKDGREVRTSTTCESPTTVGPRRNGNSTGAQDLMQATTELPYYDAMDSTPTSAAIKDLCETFFTTLGCNYPFLQREEFMEDLEEKRVDAILVNAVCAVSARFSYDPILTSLRDDSLPSDSHGCVKRAFRGQPFARRAISAIIDMFPCPTLAVTQACLLLAYEELGSDRDSGLWMYLGTTIRMAQDLGIQKLDGLHLEGRLGPTPKTVKNAEEGRKEEHKRAEQQRNLSASFNHSNQVSYHNRRAIERERIDTFWSVFFLDRAVSSGVGRPVTLRDKDIEVSFPYRDETVHTPYPNPFPDMLRIVHMYGRVADILNDIKDVSHVTPNVLSRLAAMEKDLTGIYQKLSSRLNFNAANFQYYVQVGQGTNFILLHFWFHGLIVLLHQPTLLLSFEPQIQQMLPNSRELSMSSAKTIADILAFAELIDPKSFVGNPFTSQPIYIAACAFLAEVALHTSTPPTRKNSPTGHALADGNGPRTLPSLGPDLRRTARHSLLASAANQNYQCCHRALKTLESYWAGCRYILTVLDQKSKGLVDPLLFTSEDVDEMPSTELSFTTPGWRKSSFGTSIGRPPFNNLRHSASSDSPWPPPVDHSSAIGWSISGSANSSGPNLSLLYQNSAIENDRPRKLPRPFSTTPIYEQPLTTSSTPRFDRSLLTRDLDILPPPISRPHSRALSIVPPSAAEADLLLGLHSPFSSTQSPSRTPLTRSQTYSRPPDHHHEPLSLSRFNSQHIPPPGHGRNQDIRPLPRDIFRTPSAASVRTAIDTSNLFIESQDIDMSNPANFNLNNFSFARGEMLPWLEYLPPDVLDFFGDPNGEQFQVIGGDSCSSAAAAAAPPGPRARDGVGSVDIGVGGSRVMSPTVQGPGLGLGSGSGPPLLARPSSETVQGSITRPQSTDDDYEMRDRDAV